MNSKRIDGQGIEFGDSYILPIEQSRVTIQQAKVQKIIDETDAKVQEIISNAENQSHIVVETANSEATSIIEQARKRAQEEYDLIKQQAYEEGYKKGEQDGLYKFQSDAEEGIKALETLARSSFDMKKNIIDSASHDIVELVATIADKVCHQKFNAQVLYNITVDAIRQLHDKENITIIVNPYLVDCINKLSPHFREAFPAMESIKILEDSSLSPDGVIVETLDTRLDSRISAQIAEIAEKMLTGASNELE